MQSMQRVKFARLIDPGAIVDNASWTSQVVDCAGWDYASAVFYLGATDIAMAALKLQESDDNSAWADVSGADFATNTNLNIDGSALALPDANADNSFRVIHVDVRKRKRYLKAVATAGDGTNGTYMAGLMILSRGETLPNSSAEQGGGVVVAI